MSIPPFGPIKISDLRKTFGGDDNPSLGEYYKDRVNLSGVPIRGTPISIGSFRGITVDTIVEVITSTTEVTWTPKFRNAKNVHVYVIGGGGSGGVASADVQFFFDGVAAAAGGGAGGLGYAVYPRIYIPTSARVRAATGGAGSFASGENTGKAGTTGGSSYFIPIQSLPSINANGGRGGSAAWQSGFGSQTARTSDFGTSPGGTASVSRTSQIPNLIFDTFSGGAGGDAVASGGGVRQAAGGGGAAAFLIDHDNVKNGSPATNNAAFGAKVSDYLSFPFILEGFLSNSGFQPIRSLYSFDGSNGVLGTSGISPGYGGGSGGVVRSNNGTVSSSSGGDGIVLIVYEL
jgi:hypothetical protein